MPQATGGFNITNTSQIGTGVVESDDILDATIATADMADNAITDDKIAAHTTSKITLPAANIDGDVAIADGGTGASTSTLGFNALSPMTTRGDLIFRGATNNVRIAAGTTGQFLRTRGSSDDPQWAAVGGGKEHIFTTDVVVNETTTETNILSYSVPANSLGTNNAVRFRINVSHYNRVNSTDDFTLRVQYGTTEMILTVIEGNAITYNGWFDLELIADGATNSQECVLYTDLSAQGFGTAIDVVKSHALGTAAEDSTTALNLTMSVKWAASDALNQFTASKGIVQLVA